MIAARLSDEVKGVHRRVDTEPEDWCPDYDDELVVLGYQIMERTGRIPLPDEVAAIDPDWYDSLVEFGLIVRFQYDGLSGDG